MPIVDKETTNKSAKTHTFNYNEQSPSAGSYENRFPTVGNPRTTTVYFSVDFADFIMEAPPRAEADVEEERSLDDLAAAYQELLREVPDDLVDVNLPSEY